jgi:hypothetical protein
MREKQKQKGLFGLARKRGRRLEKKKESVYFLGIFFCSLEFFLFIVFFYFKKSSLIVCCRILFIDKILFNS